MMPSSSNSIMFKPWSMLQPKEWGRTKCCSWGVSGTAGGGLGQLEGRGKQGSR